MRWLVLAVLLAGCEFDATSSKLDPDKEKPDGVSQDQWDLCAKEIGTGSQSSFSLCLKGVQVTNGSTDGGTRD
jgi:hypothetical protein